MRNVLVTGANRGLGLELVRQLATGFSPQTRNVIATCRQPQEAQALQEIKEHSELKVHILKLDVRNAKETEGLLAAVGRLLGADEDLTLLINNAGYGRNLTLDQITAEEMSIFFAVNVTAPLLITKSLLPSLVHSAQQFSKESRACFRAAVVTISSLLGSVAHQPPDARLEFMRRIIPYRASKTALNMCMRGLAHETAPMEVLVTLLHPGWVATDMGGPDAPVTPEESVREMLQTMASWDQSHHGGFFDKSGERIPW